MALLGTFSKQPGETLDYDLDADEWLPSDDFIISAVTTAPDGIVVNSTSIINSVRSVKVWVSGGTNGVTYKLEVTITSDDGRIKQSEFKIKCREV